MRPPGTPAQQDRWSLRLLRDLVGRTIADWKTPAFDLLVVALVTTVTIALNLVVAVGVGVAIAVASFLLRMSRSVVRRSYRGDVARSKRMRDPELMDPLSREGRRIVVFELEGALFFGTAEELASSIEASVRDSAVVVILDVRRVNDIDSTGARILMQIQDDLRRQGRRLLLSHADDHPAVSTALQSMRVSAAVERAAMFHDTDAALEHAEEMVIAAHRADTVVAEELPVGRLPLLDRQPRSATVTADEDLACYVLSADAFDALTIDDPPIAIHLLSNLGRELSRRLRRATAMMSQLED